MRKKLLISAIVATLLVACTSQRGPAPSNAPSPRSTPVPSSSPGAVTRTLDLPHLPPQGVVVVERNGGVAFIALDGRVIGTVHGVRLANATEAPGPVLFRRDHAWFVLDASRSVLLQISRSQALVIHVLDDPAIDMPTPPEEIVDGQAAGHWRFALLVPDGNHVLAQWSGECEVPVAYLSTLQAGPPVPITGSAMPPNIEESFALGWTRGSRAVVVLPQGSCANGAGLPGVYAFDTNGSSSLITTIPVSGGGAARMWGNG